MLTQLKKQLFTISLASTFFAGSFAVAQTAFAQEPQSVNSKVEQQSLAHRQAEFSQSLNRFMLHLNAELEIETGTAIAVVENDTMIYQENFGFADVKNKQAVTNDTLFYAASVTKPVFALALLQALKQKQQGLDTTLAELFPDVTFKHAEQVANITVKQLLDHTSGLQGNGLTSVLALTGEYDQKLLMRLLSTMPGTDQKNPEFEYSNLGYNMLSLAFSGNAKQSWQTVLSEKVLKPLSMDHSTPYISDISKNKWLVGKPYSFFTTDRDMPLYLQKRDNTMHSAGGLFSTTSDMANLLIVELNQGKLHGEQVLPSELIAQSQ